MDIIKEKTVSFTGNRTLTTSDNQPDANLENVIRTELFLCLKDCYQEGKTNFISGMAIGWDMLCAEEVLKLREQHSDIRLIIAIPFQGQELLYSEKDKHRYKAIFEAANHKEFITDGDYDKDAYHKRNDWMIANSSEIIAYDSGRPRSGTASTVRKARIYGVEVLNIYDELKNYFTISHFAKRYLQRFPFITSFRYGREGLLFYGDQQPIPVPFTNIKTVELSGEYLVFTMMNNITYRASIYSDECLVDFPKTVGPS